MDVWKSLFALARRRSVGPPIFILAIAAAVVAYLLVPTTYVSTTAMVLTTPTTGGTLSADPKEPAGLTNPLLQFNDGLRTTAGILILSMNTPEMMAKLGVRPGGPTQVTINDGRTNPDLLGISTNGPFVYIEVDSKSPAVADATVRRAGQLVRQELAARQRALKAPPSTYISITDVVPPGMPEAKRTLKWGAAAGGLLGVLVIGFGLAYLVDRVRAGRRAAYVVHAPWIAQPQRTAIPAPANEPGKPSGDGPDAPATPPRQTGGMDDETAIIVVVPEESQGGDRPAGLRLAPDPDGAGEDVPRRASRAG
ncbi:MAG: hypothetical protein IRZ07_06195 [Microbispora sp.]|nr:hypothetical protein [Microbispora sp.]